MRHLGNGCEQLIGDLSHTVNIRRHSMCITRFNFWSIIAGTKMVLIYARLAFLEFEADCMLKAVHLDEDSVLVADPDGDLGQTEVSMHDAPLMQ